MNKQVNHVLITRTDGIGDVILTLPLAVALKRLLPHVKISFLGKAYTKPVIEACRAVDYFLDWDAVKDNDAAALIFCALTARMSFFWCSRPKM